MWGRNRSLPHTLTPLELALLAIRRNAYGERPAPPDESIANFVAATVLLYEYFPKGDRPPRALGRAELDGGLFRKNGRELRYLDGREPKLALAVDAADVQCVVEMLKDPARAIQIRSKFARARSRRLRAQAAEITHQAHLLRKPAASAETSPPPRAARRSIPE